MAEFNAYTLRPPQQVQKQTREWPVRVLSGFILTQKQPKPALVLNDMRQASKNIRIHAAYTIKSLQFGVRPPPKCHILRTMVGAKRFTFWDCKGGEGPGEIKWPREAPRDYAYRENE